MNTSIGFDDLIYDADIYDGMNTFLNDLPFYKKWLPRGTNKSVLELCCGTGRLTLPLANEGFNITGVDISPSMLQRAKLQAQNLLLNIDFVTCDIKNLELNSKYDCIFIPFNSIHHLCTNDDLMTSLSGVKKHLRQNGTFILDCFNPSIELLANGGKNLKLIADYVAIDGRKIMIKEIMQYDSQSQINHIDWHFWINGVFHSVQKLAMRMFFPQELDFYLANVGFDIIHKFGDFEERPFSADSMKQIYVCRKVE